METVLLKIVEDCGSSSKYSTLKNGAQEAYGMDINKNACDSINDEVERRKTVEDPKRRPACP